MKLKVFTLRVVDCQETVSVELEELAPVLAFLPAPGHDRNWNVAGAVVIKTAILEEVHEI